MISLHIQFIQQIHGQSFCKVTEWWYAGDQAAMSQIGHMYANGDGVAQSNTTALEWFLQSVGGKEPDPSGLFGVGYMYLHGYGVEQNTTEAMEWLQGAAKRHDAEALYHLGVLRLEEPHLTTEETQEAIKYIQDAAAVLSLLRVAKKTCQSCAFPVKLAAVYVGGTGRSILTI